MVELVWLALAASLAASPDAHAISAPPASAATSFSWCGGALTVDLDHWGDASGIFTVYGWSYLYYNSHEAALRVDGSTIYASPGGVATLPLTLVGLSVDPPSARGLVVWEAFGVARVTTSLAGVDEGGCCALEALTEIENLDAVPHVFEWRWFHDTAYKVYVNCPTHVDPDVDGGEVCLPGEVPTVSCRTTEFDALAAGAVGCGKSISFVSGDTGLPGPVYRIDDTVNRPYDAEVIAWATAAGEPAMQWSGFVNGEPFAGCDGDNALLLAWRVPEGTGVLQPGGKGALKFSIGQACAPTCCTLAADAGPPSTVCAGAGAPLGGAPVALGGVPPLTYLWSPDDGTLSDVAAANPIATPLADRQYMVEVRDAAGCSARATVAVTVRANGVPADLGNTLRLVRRGDWIELDWGPVALAESYDILGAGEKSFLAPDVDVRGLTTTTGTIAQPPADLRFYRARGVSCSGLEGPV